MVCCVKISVCPNCDTMEICAALGIALGSRPVDGETKSSAHNFCYALIIIHPINNISLSGWRCYKCNQIAANCIMKEEGGSCLRNK